MPPLSMQSKPAASTMASCLLLLGSLFFTPPFAAAVEATDDNGQKTSAYEPDFPLFDRSIVGHTPRAGPLDNNVQSTDNVPIGGKVTYSFDPSSVTQSRSVLELRDAQEEELDESYYTTESESRLQRRQDAGTLYISANTCVQPERIETDDTSVGDPPQLQLWISTSSENQTPGPDQDNSTQEVHIFNEGAILHEMALPDQLVYVSVVAPNVSTEDYQTDLDYNVEFAFSIDEYYHYYDDTKVSELVWVDSDEQATIFTTQNLTAAQREVLPGLLYNMVANDKSYLVANGLRNSFCGLNKTAQYRQLDDGNSQIQTGMRNGSDNTITQDFYLDGLTPSSEYVAFLFQEPVDDPQITGQRRGGTVYRPTFFDTKPSGACTVIYNLTLCDQLQYAVPGNKDLFPEPADLARFYDNYTQTMYDGFKKSLQQIPCEAPPEQQYSLASTCADCESAYKDWLCTVAIPRCQDFSQSTGDYLQERNINAPFPNGSMVDIGQRKLWGDHLAYNSSRNPQIDDEVKPGPYKEVLPCDDVCYKVVQSCPSALGFGCPLEHMIGFNTTYGLRDNNNNETISCNWQGSGYYPNESRQLSASGLLLAMTTLLVCLVAL